jgi:DNA-binding response OmpR family regulator
LNINKVYILVVDDDEEIRSQLQKLNGHTLEDIVLEVDVFDKFDLAIEEIRKHKYDIAILDVRNMAAEQGAQDNGIEIFQQVKEVCFMPVIFYTGLTTTVKQYVSSVVHVVDKAAGIPKLIEIIQGIITSGILRVNRALGEHVEKIKREYMWNFVVENWSASDINEKNSEEIVYLIARRLALSLSDYGIDKLSKQIYPSESSEEVGEKEFTPFGWVKPMQYYIIPPIDLERPACGDVFIGNINGQMGYWLTLTPTCDFWQTSDTEHVLFANCSPLESFQLFKDWTSKLPTPSKDLNNNFERLLASRSKERYFFLPKVLDIPDIVVDLQQLATLTYDKLESLKRVASLDPTYAGEITTRFIRLYGRKGTPNLITKFVTDRLKQPLVEAAAGQKSN